MLAKLQKSVEEKNEIIKQQTAKTDKLQKSVEEKDEMMKQQVGELRKLQKIGIGMWSFR